MTIAIEGGVKEDNYSEMTPLVKDKYSTGNPKFFPDGRFSWIFKNP